MSEKHIDVDATWDGKGSLDDHRQKEFAKIKEAGFGSQSDKAKARAAKPVEIPAVNHVETGDSESDGE